MENTLSQNEIAKKKIHFLGIQSLKKYSAKEKKAFWSQCEIEYLAQFKNLTT